VKIVDRNALQLTFVPVEFFQFQQSSSVALGSSAKPTSSAIEVQRLLFGQVSTYPWSTLGEPYQYYPVNENQLSVNEFLVPSTEEEPYVIPIPLYEN
jgi:nucleoid-associated protein YgaU